MWNIESLKDLPALALLIVGLFVLFKCVVKPITNTFKQGMDMLRQSITELSTHLRAVVINDQKHIKILLAENKEDRQALRLAIEALTQKPKED